MHSQYRIWQRWSLSPPSSSISVEWHAEGQPLTLQLLSFGDPVGLATQGSHKLRIEPHNGETSRESTCQMWRLSAVSSGDIKRTRNGNFAFDIINYHDRFHHLSSSAQSLLGFIYVQENWPGLGQP